jgi:hypothetical protein
MKGYFAQLWNDPAFFSNALRSLISTVATGVGLFLANPIGRTLTERALIAAIGAIGVGAAALPSAKPPPP